MQKLRKIKVVARGETGTAKAAVRCPMKLARKSGYTVDRIFAYCPEELRTSISGLRNCFTGDNGWTPRQMDCAEAGVKAMLADRYHKSIGESILRKFAVIRATYAKHRLNDNNIQQPDMDNSEPPTSNNTNG